MSVAAEADAAHVPFLDLSDPALSLRSPAVRAAREKSWYARTPYGLAVLRHNEMGRMLNHPSLRQGSHNWPALNGITSGMFAEWWMTTILVTEGQDHRRLRKAVTPTFSGRTVQRLEPEFRKLAGELIDTFIDAGHCDFMAAFANLYAARVLTLLLGLPSSDAPRIFTLASEMGLALGVTFRQEIDRIERATAELYGFCDEVIADRKNNPGDDFMSQIVATTTVKDGLSDEELRNLTLMLVFAGVDTTRNQLGLGMSVFMQHPKQWTLLAADPALAPRAAEEVMRIRPTITWVTREAVEDFVFDGVPIAKGTTIHLLSESAGTDPRVGNDETFDIAADNERHFGFGGGVHHCLGHFVARSDMTIAFRALSQRIKNVQADGTPEWLADSGNTGPVLLPIRFEKA
jgi:cytochrome P450